MKEVPYLRDLALIVALGAATEALLDFVLTARRRDHFPGPALMSFFALFHTGIGWLALAVQMTLARPALGRLGLAGTVAIRPATVALGRALRLRHARPRQRRGRPRRARRPAQLALPLRLRAALHAGRGAPQAADQGHRRRRLRQGGDRRGRPALLPWPRRHPGPARPLRAAPRRSPWARSSSRAGSTTATSPPSRTACAPGSCASTWPTSWTPRRR